MLFLNQEIQQQFKPVEGPVRISYANLVTHISLEGPNTWKKIPIAILNKRSFQKGERKWQALGGAANLTPPGVKTLCKYFGATDLEMDEKTGMADARFVIRGDRLYETLGWLTAAHRRLVERSPSREFQSETGISVQDMEGVTFLPLGTAVQPLADAKNDTSARSIGRPPTRRIFNCFEVWLSMKAWYTLLGLKHIKFLSSDELSLTEGGSHGAYLADGSVIANNLGVPICYT